MRKLVFPLLFGVLATSMVSCEKSYVCKCYKYAQFHRRLDPNEIVGTYDLRERDRKAAQYRCNSRTYMHPTTHIVTECVLDE